MRLIEVPPSDDENVPCLSVWAEELKQEALTDRKSRKASAAKKYKKEKSLGILC